MTAQSLYSYNKGYGDGGLGRLGKYYVRLTIGPYERPKPFEAAGLRPNKYVYLPLPMEMRDDTIVGFNNQDTGMIGNILDGGVDGLAATAAAEALRQSGSAIKGLMGATGAGVSNVLSSAPVLGGIANAAGSFIDNALPADAITSAISQTMGVSPNPNPSVIFQGPKLRNFNMNWMLIPTSEKDSINIRRLVNYLKGVALPKNTIKNSAAILEYPHLVQPNFYPWDKGGGGPHGWSDKSIIRMKRCFMESVNVNYTAGNIPAFYEGTNEPVVVALSINFTEVEYFLSNDYDGTVNRDAKQNLIQLVTDKITGAGQELGLNQSDIDSLTSITQAAGT